MKNLSPRFQPTIFRNLLLCFILALSSCNKATQDSSEQRTLMAIFAHPDDEMTVSPILAKYASEGVKVYLVICTDGRYGTNDHSGLEAGDGLVAIRKEEMKCSAEKLGVELIHLDYHDQLRASEGYDGHIPHVRGLIKELHGIVSEKQPDVLITWGPDGGTNHVDHRLVGASVSQVFLSQIWDKTKKLFYVGTPSNLIDEPEGKVLRGVDPKYISTRVPYSESDWEKAYESIKCHKSQFKQDDLGWVTAMNKKRGMEISLRQFVGPKEMEESVF